MGSLVSNVLGQLGLTVAISVAAAYGLFKYLGDKWISAKFEAQLAEHKHAHDRELERLRLRINAAFDRTVKLYGREFDVLPEVWADLNEAVRTGLAMASRWEETPDINNYSKELLEAFMTEGQFTPSEVVTINAASDKTAALREVRFWKLWEKSHGAWRKAQDTLNRNSIFLSDDIFSPVQELLELIFKALSERRVDRAHPVMGPDRFRDTDRLFAEGEARRATVMQLIRSKLWEPASVQHVD
jgi:hypothetical protein